MESKEAAALSSTEMVGREFEGRLMEPEITLGLDGEEEVEAPPLTMIGPGLRKKREEEQARAEGREALSTRKRKVTKGWKFWKRPSKRTQEMMALQKGCAEISGVMGEVREELKTANKDREMLRKTLSPLPLAVDGLRRVGDNQRRTHEILEGLQECVNRTAEKDSVFFKAMDQLNDGVSRMDMVVVGMGRTFSSIERHSKSSSATLEKLAARIDASDRFMEAAFDRFQETEKQFTNYVDGNARRSAMVTVTICALMTLGITMLAYTMSRTATPVVPPAPAEAPAVPGGASGEQVPGE